MSESFNHDDAIIFDGLIVSNWSEAVFADMRRGGLTGANCTCSVWEGFRDTWSILTTGTIGSRFMAI